jgi:hypothetical protein
MGTFILTIGVIVVAALIMEWTDGRDDHRK